MGTPYVGEIRLFAGNFAINGWAFCNGQLLAISEYETLFQLIGTTYGGDGQSTFGLPDLRGRVPVHQGTGSGLSPVVIGQRAGVETVTLSSNQIPSHTHSVLASSDAASTNVPSSGVVLAATSYNAYRAGVPGAALNAPVPSVGGNQPHTNMQPFLAINYIISLFGIFPSAT
jgi:microcystin-dependent protein